ncbi:MAG: methyltransferase domain-containing protein, partial [Candidatus Pacearchaeota archaeon]|nr:methyltransferase domain-containing protein [Candidatus Pacearchaeota archaeon]
WYPYPDKLTGVGLDVSSKTKRYYATNMIRANGKQLPFANNSFDWVHSNAVLEHVGNDSQQEAFIRELYRVSSKGVMMTTPDRYFPFDLHTSLPLIHWLPKPIHRLLLKMIGLKELAREEDLNLIGKSNAKRLGYTITHATYVKNVKLFGWSSNLLIWLRK